MAKSNNIKWPGLYWEEQFAIVQMRDPFPPRENEIEN